MKELVPVLATWDDDDTGARDSGASNPLVEEAERVFTAFFVGVPRRGAFERGPGVSAVFVAFGQRFIVMDSRSRRQPGGDMDPSAHWGQEQTEKRAHPKQFSAFLARLASREGKVALLSGGLQRTEVGKRPFAPPARPFLYEISAGPWHGPAPVKAEALPPLLAAAEGPAFVVVEVDASATGETAERLFDVSAIGVSSPAPLFEIRGPEPRPGKEPRCGAPLAPGAERPAAPGPGPTRHQCVG